MAYERPDSHRRAYGASANRSTLGYWVPLVVTVTIASAGLVAWIWSERKDSHRRDDNRREGDRPPRPPGLPPGYGPTDPNQPPYTRDAGPPQGEEEGIVARMSGALRRTPSPQQIFDTASRRVVQGVSAAGAVVGTALASIREEDRRDYEDHSRWSEEAEARGGAAADRSSQPLAVPRTNDKRKTVAIVLSADRTSDSVGQESAYHQEHASILSHLPPQLDANYRIFVLIYAPDIRDHPQSANVASQPAASLSSSYSNIEHGDTHSPHDEQEKPLAAIDPRPISSSPPTSSLFGALYREARGLVEKESMIMPFTTLTGYVQILRHIAPEIVYVQETLSGPDGNAAKDLSGWVRQVVLVVGDESGHGGLVDSEDERGAASQDRSRRWWINDPRIGLGKGIEVVEGLRMSEDWNRRVRGQD